MLYIISNGKERIWHVGEKNPIGFKEVSDVDEVQADGDELQHIQDMFINSTFPIPNGRVVRWFGDHARLIIGNL